MRSKATVIVAVVLGAVAGVLLTLILSFIFAVGCTTGDGGVPYISPDSPQADVCAAAGDGLALAALCLAAVAGATAAAYMRGRAWLEGRSSPIAFILLTLLIFVSPMFLTWLISLPADGCSDEELAAYEEWQETDGEGEPPYECQIY
jgi:hypothetical protein